MRPYITPFPRSYFHHTRWFLLNVVTETELKKLLRGFSSKIKFFQKLCIAFDIVFKCKIINTVVLNDYGFRIKKYSSLLILKCLLSTKFNIIPSTIISCPDFEPDVNFILSVINIWVWRLMDYLTTITIAAIVELVCKYKND